MKHGVILLPVLLSTQVLFGEISLRSLSDVDIASVNAHMESRNHLAIHLSSEEE